jgi:hypothetical protein
MTGGGGSGGGTRVQREPAHTTTAVVAACRRSVHPTRTNATTEQHRQDLQRCNTVLRKYIGKYAT